MDASDKNLPWGSLKGVRPVKLAYRKLKEGLTDEEITAFLMDKYNVSGEKAAFSVEIAKKEEKIIKDSSPEGYCLYIGIPFCPTRCMYCSFASFPADACKEAISPYLDALFSEMEHCARLMKGKRINAVYIGGGTPTALPPKDFERLLEGVVRYFDTGSFPEYTCESGRPDSITAEHLHIMKEYGISRICINPQSMNEKTLRRIGRFHTPDDVRDAFYMAREQGFSNINMDIILGLPGEDEEDLKYTLEEIKSLSPDALTVHCLAVKRGSKLHEALEEYEPLSGQKARRHLALSAEYARGMGMEPYYLYRQKHMIGNLENTGWALPGKEGIYNVLTMEETCSIYAIGAGTVSKKVSYEDGFKAARCDTVKSPVEYAARIEEMKERKSILYGE